MVILYFDLFMNVLSTVIFLSYNSNKTICIEIFYKPLRNVYLSIVNVNILNIFDSCIQILLHFLSKMYNT